MTGRQVGQVWAAYEGVPIRLVDVSVAHALKLADAVERSECVALIQVGWRPKRLLPAHDSPRVKRPERMAIRRSAAALAITASLTSTVCKADDSGSLISIDVPSMATCVESQIRSEFLVVGYQDGENVVVQGAGFHANTQWTKDFGKGRLIGFAADDMGATVVVYLVPDLQERVKSVVLRNGSEVFSHEGENIVKSSPSGRFFYHQTNRTNSELRDEQGHPFALPGELGKQNGHYDFIGRDYLLAVVWNLEERTEGPPIPTLALVRLPAKVVWTLPLPGPGLVIGDYVVGESPPVNEPYLVHAGEESIAMGDDFLVIGERWHMERVPHRDLATMKAMVHCLEASGEVRWQHAASSGILGVGLIGRSYVIVALSGSFLALDAKDGTVVSKSPPLSAITSVDGDTIVEVSHVTTDEHHAIFNLLTYVKGQQVVEESVIAYVENGGIEYEHLKGFSEVVVVGAKLFGIPKDNAAIATEVPAPTGN